MKKQPEVRVIIYLKNILTSPYGEVNIAKNYFYFYNTLLLYY